MKKLPIALQVYSVRGEASEDFPGVMREVKAMGYDGVELAGLYGLDPETVRDAILAAGLVPISAHVPFVELIGDTAGTIAKYATIGCTYIAIPYLTEEHRPQGGKFDEVVGNIRRIGEECLKNGITLLYHNHDFEFEKMPDGRYMLDYLYETVSEDLLKTQIDTCWARVAGVDPAAYVRKYSGRCPIVHLKDFVGGKSEGMYELIGIESGETAKRESKFEMRALGDGVQDFPAIIGAAAEGGALWLVVEQDNHPVNSPMENSRLSVSYLKSIGL